jgi:hypothetical protein
MSVSGERRRNWSTVSGIKSNCRIQPNGCWVWLGGCCGNTPKIRAFDPSVNEKRPMSGARAMWLAAFGRAPRGLAFGACPTPKCLNPLHLREVRTQAAMQEYRGRTGRFKGTHLEQRAAAAAKGRAAQGMVDTPADKVMQIREAPAWVTHTALSRSTGVHRKTVSMIRRGLLYRHVPDPAPLG